MVTANKRPTFLLVAWTFSFVLALVCIGIFAQGVIRDHRVGQPVIEVDFSEPSGWKEERFRVWGEDSYKLFISSVNHDPEFVGRHLVADFQVRIDGAQGNTVFAREYYGEYLMHKVPNGYGDTALAEINISGWPWQQGVLAVRVTEPDPAFRTTRSELKLWKVQRDVGMGGLINYAMLLPGILLLLLAFAFAVPLARRGHKWPLIVTASVLILFLTVFMG